MTEYKKGGRYFKKTAITSALFALTALAGQAMAHGGHNNSRVVNCDIAIVGGGPAGVHTAYQLTTKMLNGLSNKRGVCLIEKEDHLGGRYLDKVVGDPSGSTGYPYGGLTGTGAYRMYTTHYTNGLYDELFGTTIDTPADLHRQAELGQSLLNGVDTPKRGLKFAYNTYGEGALAQFYYGLISPDTEGGVWDAMLCGKGAVHPVPLSAPDSNGFSVPLYKNVPGMGNMSTSDYLEYTVGKRTAEYFKDIYTFRSDFQLPVDAAAYMEYNSNDFAGFAGPYYAVPGHTILIKAMRDKIVQAQNGSDRIFLNEEIDRIEKNNHSSYKYRIESDDTTFLAKKVIIATESSALTHMDGDIVDRITNQPYFKSILPATALTITHRWDRRWWNDFDKLERPGVVNPSGLGDPIRRAATNVKTPNGYCLNRIEMPNVDYHSAIRVTRSVYVDDADCAKDWNDLYRSQGEAGVNREVLASLKVLFPQVFKGRSTDPKIQKTAVTYVPHAWSIIKQGSLGGRFGPVITVDKLNKWSQQPLAGEDVYLTGDSYKVSFGWSASAYMSSAQLLNAKFGGTIGSVGADPNTFPQLPLEFPTIKCDSVDRSVKYPGGDFCPGEPGEVCP